MTPERIKKMRKRLGWTQRDLAERIGVTDQTIWNWEHGTTIPPPEAALLERVFRSAKEPQSA